MDSHRDKCEKVLMDDKILPAIFKHMSLPTILKARQVCKTWFKASSEHFSAVAELRIHTDFCEFACPELIVPINRKTDLQRRRFLISKTNFQKIDTAIDFYTSQVLDQGLGLSAVEKLTILTATSSHNAKDQLGKISFFMAMPQIYSHVKILTVCSTELCWLKESLPYLPKLCSLRILPERFHFSERVDVEPVVDEFTPGKLPELKKFRVVVPGAHDVFPDIEKWSWILEQAPKLEKVSFEMRTIDDLYKALKAFDDLYAGCGLKKLGISALNPNSNSRKKIKLEPGFSKPEHSDQQSELVKLLVKIITSPKSLLNLNTFSSNLILDEDDWTKLFDALPVFGKNLYISNLRELNLSIRAKPADEENQEDSQHCLGFLPRPSRTPFLTNLNLHVFISGGQPVLSQMQKKFCIANIKKLRLRFLHSALESPLCFPICYKERFPNLREADIRVSCTTQLKFTMQHLPERIEVLKLYGLAVPDDETRIYDANAVLVCYAHLKRLILRMSCSNINDSFLKKLKIFFPSLVYVHLGDITSQRTVSKEGLKKLQADGVSWNHF